MAHLRVTPLSCFSFIFFHVFCFVSFFLFSFCISFKNVLLLALVSEFNCFLRSRCSIEMWGPDDTRRDSWDWVGLARVRASFNSVEWGRGSSPVKTEPLQIVLLLLLLLFVRFVRARRRYPLFKRRDPWRATTTLTQGATVLTGENCPSNAVLTRKTNTINTRCDQMRSCNGLTCAHSTACASRFRFSCVVDLWETLRYRVSIRTIRRNTTEGSFTLPALGTCKSVKAPTSCRFRSGPGADVTHGFHSDIDPREADCDSHRGKTPADATNSMVILFSPTPQTPRECQCNPQKTTEHNTSGHL